MYPQRPRSLRRSAIEGEALSREEVAFREARILAGFRARMRRLQEPTTWVCLFFWLLILATFGLLIYGLFAGWGGGWGDGEPPCFEC